MFCPECKTEYRSGFTHCADCDVDLVKELRKESHSGERLQNVWSGESQSDCVQLCQDLTDAGITYEVSQVPIGPSRSMGVDFRFEINVPHSSSEQARRLVEANPDEIFELPADSRLIVQDDAAKRAYLRKFHPEDAIVEIFSENPENYSSAVKLSLQTNLIHFRAEVLNDGSAKLFVLPEDESCAREIVREIREGKPPE